MKEIQSILLYQIMRWIYPLFVPSQFRAIQNNLRLGLTIGKKVKLLIAEPLEERLLEPLASLRISLSISADDVMAVRKGGRSLLVSAIYRAFGRLN